MVMGLELDGARIECVLGDITRQEDLEAVVNAANARLAPGGGVAGAIHRVGGPDLYRECRNLAPIETSEAVITAGHSMPNRYIIHALGPIYRLSEEPKRELARTYRNIMRVAEEHGIRSLGLVAISTGAFGFPAREAAEIAVQTVFDILPECPSLWLVRFVLWDEASLRLHGDAIGRLGD